jgi:hypothetical protein
MKWLNDQIYPNNSTFLTGHNNAIKKVMVKLRTNNNCVLCEEGGRHKIPNGNLVCDNHHNMLVAAQEITLTKLIYHETKD